MDTLDTTATALQRGEEFLFGARLDDGSWPYTAGGPGYPEPTALSLIALVTAQTPPAEVLTQGREWLTRHINPAGAVVLENDTEPHWSTAQTLRALVWLKAPAGLIERCARQLLSWTLRQPAPTPDTPMNVKLRGWPWNNDTFSWVDPTVQAILALRAAGFGQHERIKEAELMLLDRACPHGGWNYGNSIVLGRELKPFPYTTALALIALQSRRNEPAVTQSLAYLQEELHHHQSTLSLALAIPCLRCYDQPIDPWIDALLKRQEANGSWNQQIHLTALAVLALRSAGDGPNVYQN